MAFEMLRQHSIATGIRVGGVHRPGDGGGSGGTSGNDTLTGTSGDDTLSGLAGNDTISGAAGADTIDGGDGNDVLYSGDVSPPYSFPYYGNSYTPPVLDTANDQDTISGGAGDDVIFAGYGDKVDGGDQSSMGDRLFVSFLAASSGVTFDFHLTTQTIGTGTITGIESVSWVQGSNYDDYIDLGTNVGTVSWYSDNAVVEGMGGNDTLLGSYTTSLLDGGDGDDVLDGRVGRTPELDGGAGNDIIYGSYGMSVARGGDGNDTIYSTYEAHGGAGDDIIVQGAGGYPTLLSGDGGDDRITGNSDIDTIEGNDGNDTLHGGARDDFLDGGADADLLSGDAGNDKLTGGAGDDTFVFGQGDGQDTITDFANGDSIQVNGYASAQSVMQVGGDVVVVFSSGDQITLENSDVATVQSGLHFEVSPDETLTGGAGNDRLLGYGGNDTIIGNAGADILAGGSGSDTIDGGDDSDMLYSGDESPAYGFPYYGKAYTPPLLDTGSEHDTLSGGAGDDVIFAGYGDTVDGGAGAYYGDKLFISFQGATEGVTFDAHLATQTIGGGTISGIEAISWVQGSNFADYIDAGTAPGSSYSDRTVVEGMAGDDTLIAGYRTSLLDGGAGNDVVDGRNSGELQEIHGGAGDDTIYANAGTGAVAYGEDGNDTIYSDGEIHGGAGDDVIHVLDDYYPGPVTGDDGNDTIFGCSTADDLNGGAGDDVLTGGGGGDLFVVGEGDDTITDFSAGDKLAIENSFSGSAIYQIGSDVVITFDDEDQLTFKNMDLADVNAALHTSVQINDVAITADGATIYGAGADGTLYVYDGATGELERAWHVSTSLGGIDISPDGTFVMVTEMQPLATHADPAGANGTWTIGVDRVDLGTGITTTYSYDVSSPGTFYDVAVLADGDALLSQRFGGTLKLLNPDLGTFTALNQLGDETVFSVNQSGSVVFAGAQNNSGGPIYIYEPGSGVTVTSASEGFNDGVQAISENGQLIAQWIYNQGVNIYNAQLQPVADLTQLHPEWMNGAVSGLAFDQSGKYLFVLDNETNVISKLSTSNWSTVAEYNVGSDLGSVSDVWDGDFGNRLLVSPDMSYFTVVANNGALIRVDATGTQPTDGNDTLVGTSAADTIDGLGGDDLIAGAGGDDVLHGSGGDDAISGGAGADTLDGGADNDTLYTGGASALDNGAEHDAVTAGAGDDEIWAGYGDAIDGGAGSDSLHLSLAPAAAGVTLDTDTLIAGTTIAGGTIQNIEKVVELQGTEFGDTLTLGASAAGAIVHAGGGDDDVTSSADGSIVEGGDGADTITMNGQSGSVHAGAGDDLITFSGISAPGSFTSIYGEDGNDTITLKAPSCFVDGGSGDDVFVSSGASHVLMGGDGFDTVDYSSAAAGITVDLATFTGAGGDSLHNIEIVIGSAFADTFSGDAGSNGLVGGDGNDTLEGGHGVDTLVGGAGDDAFLYATGDGTDYIEDFAAGDTIKVVGYSSAQALTQNGSDVIAIFGSGDQITFKDTTTAVVQAGMEFDGPTGLSLTGTSGGDTIRGSGGDDYLYGLAGSDKLIGDAGNDILRGGLDIDTLTGGTGADVFQFEANNGNDRVMDFESGIDSLDFHLLAIASADVQARLKHGNMVLSVDADHDARVDFSITLVGVAHVDAGDYIFS